MNKVSGGTQVINDKQVVNGVQSVTRFDLIRTVFPDAVYFSVRMVGDEHWGTFSTVEEVNSYLERPAPGKL